MQLALSVSKIAKSPLGGSKATLFGPCSLILQKQKQCKYPKATGPVGRVLMEVLSRYLDGPILSLLFFS